MPSYLAIPHFHLSKLPATTKIAVTCFALCLIGALGFVSLAVFAERTGYRTGNVQANFRGDEAVTRETGERFDRMYAEPSRRAIYDIVHPHSFLMPILYFILCHLMEMCWAPRAFKMGLYLFSFAAMMLVISAPLLVWSDLRFGFLVIPAVIGMTASFLVMLVVPVWQMWFGTAKGGHSRSLTAMNESRDDRAP